MKHCKAQLSSSFNYIFALIIGGIVFMFFVGFAYKFMGFADSVSAAELVSSLNDEFGAFSVSDSAEKSLDFSSTVSFRVYEGQLMSKGQSKVIDHAVFAPFEVSGKTIYLATRSLEIPYRVGNLYYITDGKTVYVLVYDASTSDVIEGLQSSYNSIPSIFPTERVSTTQLSTDLETLYKITASYEHVRFIFFSDPENYIDSISETFSNYEILQIVSTEEDYYSGKVEYPNEKEVIYIGPELLIGAMVAEDADAYTYTLTQVFEKLSRLTGVYYDKTKFLSLRLPNCDYATMKTALNNYKVFLSDEDNYDLYSLLLSKLEIVEDANKNLGGECPEIY